MRDPKFYEQAVLQTQAKRDLLQTQLATNEEKCQALQTRLEEGIIPAQAFLQAIANETQMKIKYRIEAIAQKALDAVWPGRYTFHIDFDPKRGKNDARIYVMKGEYELDPLKNNGGGLADILSMALRISTLLLARTERVIILDEPMKNVSRSLRDTIMLMLKELSVSLGIQFILITHEDSYINGADRIFEVAIQPEGDWEVSHVSVHD